MSPILFWNCRGARKKATGNYLRHLISDHDVQIIGLMETKVEELTRKEIDKIAGRSWDFFHQPASGKSGGILMLWRKYIVAVQIIATDTQCLITQVFMPDSSKWNVVFVYASKDYHTRRLMWELIAQNLNGELPGW